MTLVLALVALTCNSFAQSIYFKAGGGYAIPIASQSIGEKYHYKQDYTNANNPISKQTAENVSGSFGAGANFNVGAGYMFNEYIGVELNAQYTLGKKIETSNIETYTTGSYSSSTEHIIQHYSRGIYLNPSFILTTARGSKIPYGRFGLVVGSQKIMKDSTYTYTDGFYNSTGTGKGEYSGGISLGFQGAVGINWMLSDKIDLFTEVNFISMTYYAEEYEVTEYNSNGYDYLPELSVSQKKTVFKKEIELGESQNPDKPREELREGSAFSSLSLQVGIRFLLNGHGM